LTETVQRSVAGGTYSVPDEQVGDEVMAALDLHPGAELGPEELTGSGSASPSA